MNRSSLVRISLAVLLIGGGAGLLLAGPLAPPAGSVASSYKTLTEVEPRIAINATNTPGDADNLFRITQPGSYYFTENITGVSGKNGIEIAAESVTIDLRGFALLGVPGSLNGIVVDGTGNDSSVRNGSVSKWGGDGVKLGGTAPARNFVIESISASFNGGIGVRGGVQSVVRGCVASANGSHGITAGTGSSVTDCASYDNIGSGILGATGCTIVGCSGSFNDGDGIACGGYSTITNCSGFANGDDGIAVAAFCTVVNCTAGDNRDDGFVVNTGCTLSNCTASLNDNDGILVTSDCIIRNNTCHENGDVFSGGGDGAGIHVIGAANRIEGNNCTGQDRGIDIDVGGNIIIRNTCSGNTTNWDIAAGNALAPILVATTNPAAVLGDTYAGTLGSTDPNANFTY